MFGHSHSSRWAERCGRNDRGRQRARQGQEFGEREKKINHSFHLTLMKKYARVIDEDDRIQVFLSLAIGFVLTSNRRNLLLSCFGASKAEFFLDLFFLTQKLQRCRSCASRCGRAREAARDNLEFAFSATGKSVMR